MIFQIVAVGIIGMVLAVFVKNYNPALAVLTSFAAGLLIFMMLLPLLGEAIGFVRHLSTMADGAGEYTTLALRVIGIAYIAELGSSVCADANENTIAAKIDMAGRVVILVMAMPVVVDIVRLVTEILP